MEYEDLNEAISVALENKWGFQSSVFVPRSAIALVRGAVHAYSPELFNAKGFYLESIEKVIKTAKWTDSSFTHLEPIYSGSIDKSGKLHIYKAEKPYDRYGDVEIEPQHVDVFMGSVFHYDWKQTLPFGDFSFWRTDLQYLPKDFQYITYY